MILHYDTLGHFPGLAARSEHARSFARAQPFPHACIEGFVDPQLLARVRAEFPAPAASCWINEDDGGPSHRKLAMTDARDQLGPYTKHLIAQLHSGPFVALLERVTGIGGLIPDPSLYGGGLHQVLSGGFLKIHGDFLEHPRLGLRRRLNLIIYLNDDWSESYGGELELWDSAMSRRVCSYAPLWNRAILFAVEESGYHGHPDPVRCPAGVTRKSLSLFYYTRPERVDRGADRGVSEWRRRSGERLFRPAGLVRAVVPPIVFDLRNQPRYVLRRFVSPFVVEAIQALRESLDARVRQ